MYSKVSHKYNILPPPRILQKNSNGVCNDDKIRVGKLRMWKQWANCYRGMCV
jgi:hypothetical protein